MMNWNHCIALSVALLASGPALSATINSVSIMDGGSGLGRCGTTDPQSSSGASTQGATLNDGGINCTVAADAYAGGGAVGYRATATLNSFTGPLGSYVIQGGARSVMSDIFITPTFDINDPNEIAKYGYQVSVSLNAKLEGIGSGAVVNSTGQGAAGNSIKATATLSGFSEFGNFTSNTSTVFGGAGAINSGLLSDFDDFGQAMNPTILQDWRIGMSIIFNLDTNVSVVSSNGGNIFSSTLDAYNSLSFSKTGPAFLLSEGFTINAPELNIFDNRWVDPRAPVGPSPVPLPASLPLLLLGGLALGAVRHAQRKFVT